MNDLEKEIEEYIVTHEIEGLTAKQLADKFFISRAYLYKVIKKMGYSSYTELKYEKKLRLQCSNRKKPKGANSNSKLINDMYRDICTSNIIYVIGFNNTFLVAQYFTRQLMNLGQLVVPIGDTSTLKKYMRCMTKNDMVIYFSNTGRRVDIHERLVLCGDKYYVITKYQSALYSIADKRIGFDNEIDNLSNKYDQEDISMLLMLSHTLLTKFKNRTIQRKGESL